MSNPTRPAGRPPRQIHDPELQARIDANRKRTTAGEKALIERRTLILEALAHGWPQRRIADALAISPGTVSRIAADRSG